MNNKQLLILPIEITFFNIFIMKKKLLITFLIVFSIQLQLNAQFRQLRLANEELAKENFDKLLKKFPQFKKELEITVEVRESIRSSKKK